MKQGPINVGVIGVGAFAARQHLPNLARDPRYRIHSLCDLNEDLLAQRAAQFRPVRTTTRADALLADREVDVIFIGTRSRQHADLLLRTAAHGKHAFVEKPMTMTFEETANVLEAVKRAGVTVGIGFNRRFAPAMVEAKRLFDGYRKGPSNVIYRIVDDHEIRPAYIFDMNDGGGHFLQEGCHIIDLLSWFLNAEPTEVYAAGPLETDNVALFKYSDGSIATIVCGGKGGLFYPKESMEVFCNRTTLAVDQFYELRLDGPGRSVIQHFALDPNSTGKLCDESMTAFYEASFAQRPEHDVTDIAEGNALHKLKPDKGHTQAIQAFADAVAKGVPYAPGVNDGARGTVVALRAYESIRTGLPVKINAAEYGGRADSTHT